MRADGAHHPHLAARWWWRDPVVALQAGVLALAVVQVAVLGAAGRTLAAAVPTLLGLLTVLVVRATGGAHGGDGGEEAGRRWLRGLAVAGVALAVWVLGAFAAALPAGIGQPSSFYVVKTLVVTPLGDHNTAAGLLLVPLVAAVLVAQRQHRWWGGVATITLGLTATLSRGAPLVLLVVALVALAAGPALGIARRVTGRIAAAAAAALAGVTLAATVLDAAVPLGTAPATGLVGASVLGRLDLVVRGVEVAADHPWLGAGLGAFGSRAGDLPPPSFHAHNALAHAAAEGGVLLLAIVVTLAVVLAVRAWRQPPGWRRTIGLLGGAALVGHAQIDILAGLVGFELTFAVLVTLAAAPARPVAGTSSDGTRCNR